MNRLFLTLLAVAGLVAVSESSALFGRRGCCRQAAVCETECAPRCERRCERRCELAPVVASVGAIPDCFQYQVNKVPVAPLQYITYACPDQCAASVEEAQAVLESCQAHVAQKGHAMTIVG